MGRERATHGDDMKQRLLRTAVEMTVITLILVATGCKGQESFRAWKPPPKGYSSIPSSSVKTARWESDECSPFHSRINGMALALHKSVSAQDPGHNLFLSPASLEIALAMAANGAAGGTLAAIKSTLGIADLSDEQMNRSNKAFMNSIDRLDPSIELDVANSLWLRHDLQFGREFLENNQQYYEAEVRQVDFQNPATAEEINRWVSEKTHGRIPSIFTPPPGSNFMLADAIYFKGTWRYPFNKSETADQDFRLMGGGNKTVPMMHRLCTGDYYENEQFQMAVLEYGDADPGQGRLSMYVFLPREVDGIKGFIDSLSAENWKTWISAYCITPVDLRIPRFTFDTGILLNDALSTMGMGLAFGENADFSRMTPGAAPGAGIHIEYVQQKSFVDVNEEGTEAAAVTTIAEGEGEPPRDDTVHTMVVDHPFFFAIRDESTGAILFTGTVLNP